jgi:hypothetical protein
VRTTASLGCRCRAGCDRRWSPRPRSSQSTGWALTPLTARAVAAFLLGFAVAATIAVLGNCLRRFRGAAATYAVFGALELLGAAIHSGDFRDGASLPLFLLFFATVLAVGLAGALLRRADQVANSRSAFSVS